MIDTRGACSRCAAQITVVDEAPTLCDACHAAASYADGRNGAERDPEHESYIPAPEPPVAPKKVPRAKKSG